MLDLIHFKESDESFKELVAKVYELPDNVIYSYQTRPIHVTDEGYVMWDYEDWSGWNF